MKKSAAEAQTFSIKVDRDTKRLLDVIALAEKTDVPGAIRRFAVEYMEETTGDALRDRLLTAAP